MNSLKTTVRKIASAGLLVGLITAQGISSDTNINDQTMINGKLDSFLSEYITDEFSGTLLIAKDGKIIHAQGYGFSDRENQIPNTIDTVYSIGTLTRYFTAAAILKLVEQGKVNLSDTLPKFFENVPVEKQGITVHHLLTHTSGLLGDDELDAFEVADIDEFLKDVFSRENEVSPAVYLPTFSFKPGDRVIEFNEGYNLLSLIIEKQSGQPFEVFLKENLFDSAGITDTGYYLPNWDKAQVAKGYVGDKDENKEDLVARLKKLEKLPLYLQGSMGLLSTATDLYKWHKALYSGKVLSDASLKLLHNRHMAIPASFEADIDTGYGIQISETWTGTPWIFNIGSGVVRKNLPGFNANYHYFPAEDTVTILIRNTPTNRKTREAFPILVRTLLEPDFTPASIDNNQAK